MGFWIDADGIFGTEQDLMGMGYVYGWMMDVGMD